MPTCKLALILALAAALAACGNEPDPNAQEVDDFAARIGTPKQAKATPTAAKPATQPADPATDPTTKPATEDNTPPAPSQCSAPKVAPFYGRKSDENTQAAVMAAVAPQTNVRFIEAGTAMPEDTGSQRLNVMIDVNGIIREARCG
ncbi:MAG: hypothetical protein ABJP34_09545 [Erythrobacter sp.]